MTELNIYRFIMICLVITAGWFGVKRYGDYRVNQLLTSQPLALQGIDQQTLPVTPQLAQWSSPPINHLPIACATPQVPQQVLQRETQPSSYHFQAAAPAPPPAMATLSDQRNPPSQRESWRPPAQSTDPPQAVQQPAAARETNSALAQIREIQKQLGGPSVVDILGENSDVDSERLFARTISQLQQQQARQPLKASSSRPAVDASMLSPDEISVVQQHLRQLAETLKSTEPNKAEACQHLAERLNAFARQDMETQKR